jgi:hypothetical protein
MLKEKSWTGHVEHMDEIRNAYKTSSQNFWKEETTWENQALMGGKILKWILKKYGVRVWTESMWLILETSGRLL